MKRMKLIRYYESTKTLRVVPESFDDLYLLAIIIAEDDRVGARSYRRFKPSEGDLGEQKEVFVKINVEKVELDKNAGRLRLIGRIMEGRPEEFVRINSYHTINLAPNDTLEIEKAEWSEFVFRRLRQAVADAKKPRLGIIVMDDEKATIAYVKGYGIEISGELYSHLSKKMKEKEYERQRTEYFNTIVKAFEGMRVELVILGGPGFTKDDLKKYIESKGIETTKRLVYASASDAERSGVREVMKSETVSKLLEGEHVKKEFEYLDLFFRGLRAGSSIHGAEKIERALEEYKVGLIIVNDSQLNNASIRPVLNKADSHGVRIEIFNADDEAGKQLSSFSGIAAIEKSLLH